MSNQPTPETDAAAWVETNQANALVLASFARNLERQRDKAREELVKLRVENDHNWQATADLEEMIKLARELRDKLRALAEECLLPEFNQEWDTFVEAESALTKAKEVLP